TSFFLLGGFVVFFVAISVWLVRKFSPESFKTGLKFGENITRPADVAAILPTCSTVLPFLLLMMVTLRLPLTNPSPVFGLALLLVVLLLGLAKIFSQDFLPLVGMVCVAALEAAWHFNRFDPAHATQPLTWYLIFYAAFALFPFLFLRQFR